MLLAWKLAEQFAKLYKNYLARQRYLGTEEARQWFKCRSAALWTT